MIRNLTVLVAALCLSLSLPACARPPTYSAEAIEAWVVDAETKKPLEGVVVTANWQLEEGTFGGNVQAGQLMVLETVSDRNGRIYFPAWGPRQAPKGHLTSNDPQLLFFKSGYEHRRLSNRVSTDRKRSLEPVRTSEWNGRTITLRRFSGVNKDYAAYLAGDYRPIIRFLLESEDWKKTPCLLAALDVEAKKLGYIGFLELFPIPILERERRVAESLRRKDPCERH